MTAQVPQDAPIPILVDSPLPKYHQLKIILRKQIADWKPDQPIPSEAALCETYGVSRTTVRKALNDLVYEGLLYTVQGKGTFVSAGKFRTQWAHQTAGFHADMAPRGFMVRSQVLKLGVVPADEQVARQLQVRPGVQVIKLVRLRYINDEPFDICTNYLPYQRFAGLERENFTHKSLYDTLHNKYQVRLHKGIRLVEADKCTSQEAELLGVPPDSPVLVLSSRMYDVDGHPVEYGIACQRGDRAQLELEISAE